MAKIIKNICYIPDTGRLILSDSDNNHYLCDIYGNKNPEFLPYISGCISGLSRKKLLPLSVSIPQTTKNKNFTDYFPITRKFEGYSQFPRPLVPPFANIPAHEIKSLGKKQELIEQLQKYFSIDKTKFLFTLPNDNKALEYLTCDLNQFDSVKGDTEILLKLIDNTFEEYRKIYKYKLNILHKNPVVKALTQFKNVISLNKEMKIINGRVLNRPNIDIQEKFYLINNIINRAGLKKKDETKENKMLISKTKYLIKKDNGKYQMSPKRMKFGLFSYEQARLDEERKMKEEEERKLMEEQLQKEEQERLKQLEEQRKQQEEKRKLEIEQLKEGLADKNVNEDENPFPEGPDIQEVDELLSKEKAAGDNNEQVNEDGKNEIKENVNEDEKSENISFISADTQAERLLELEMKRKQREKELAEREVRLLSGFLDEIKQSKEDAVFVKYEFPTLKHNGILFESNLQTLQKTNPIAFKIQEQKDKYDRLQLERKREQTKINSKNLGFKKSVEINKEG